MPSPIRYPLLSKLDGAILVSVAAMGAFGLLMFAQQLPQALLA